MTRKKYIFGEKIVSTETKRIEFTDLNNQKKLRVGH